MHMVFLRVRHWDLHCDVLRFAVNAMLYFAGTNREEMVDIINWDLDSIFSYMYRNDLIANIKNFEYVSDNII